VLIVVRFFAEFSSSMAMLVGGGGGDDRCIWSSDKRERKTSLAV
jgi:hypothetical protein